jgi:hypothetical protein
MDFYGESADDLVPSVDPADLRRVLCVLRASNPKMATGMGAFARLGARSRHWRNKPRTTSQ